MPKYSIGVVTYINRFEKYFKPLVFQLEKFFPDVEKNYALNGFYNQERQEKYLTEAKGFLSKTSASTVTAYKEHHALSHCWNQLVINSKKEKILIMNDDVRVSRLFRFCFDLQVGLYETAVINRSWSHFIISKETVKKVGWFDERLVGVGHEDADYGLRLAIASNKKQMPKNWQHQIFCLGLKNIIAKNEDPGWKNISATTSNKYAEINLKVFKEKWDISDQPKEGYLHAFNAGYYAVRPGMETPLFYPLSALDKKA